MRLCFAALIKVLRICAKPKIYNKTLVEAVIIIPANKYR